MHLLLEILPLASLSAAYHPELHVEDDALHPTNASQTETDSVAFIHVLNMISPATNHRRSDHSVNCFIHKNVYLNRNTGKTYAETYAPSKNTSKANSFCVCIL